MLVLKDLIDNEDSNSVWIEGEMFKEWIWFVLNSLGFLKFVKVRLIFEYIWINFLIVLFYVR